MTSFYKLLFNEFKLVCYILKYFLAKGITISRLIRSFQLIKSYMQTDKLHYIQPSKLIKSDKQSQLILSRAYIECPIIQVIKNYPE